MLLSVLLAVPVFGYGELQGSYERNFVARVIFAEAGPICSDYERTLVASVMVARIGHPGFDNGKLNTMYQVAVQPIQFSCIGDIKNTNWAKSADSSKMSEAERQVWDHCYSLAGGNFQQQYGPSGRPLVYYHDKSISKPSRWDNQYFSSYKEIDTDHFIFYSVLPASKAATGVSETRTQPDTIVTLILYVHNGSSSGPIIPTAQVTGQDGSGNSFQQITNSDGYVKITGDAGTWSFTASAEGYETISWTQPISLSGTKHAFLQKSLGGINFTSIKLSYIGVTEDDSGNMKFDYIFKAQKAKETTDGVDSNAFRGLGLNAFITGLTVPNDKFWVNLMPWEPDRIIDEELSRTEIGKIMLEADLQMKKDFSNYANPCENEQGKTFWNLLDIKREELVQKCMIRYPGEIKNIDNVFFGVVARHWIVPDRVYAYTNDTEIYIINATLAINSEPVTDHASFELKNQDIKDFSKECLEELNRSAREFSEYSKDLEDTLILPYVVVDVNHADRYEDLRNVYTALALAQWYKSKTIAEIDVFREGFGFSDSDSLNVSGIWSPREIWEDYVYSFENGEYKCWDNTTTKTAEGTEIKSRLYSAGGVDFLNINDKLVEIDGVPPEIKYQVETAVAKGFVEDGDEVLFGSRVHITRSEEAAISRSGSGSGSDAGTGPTPTEARRQSNANGGGNETSQDEEAAQVTCPEGWIGPNEKGECRRYIPLIPMVST